MSDETPHRDGPGKSVVLLRTSSEGEAALVRQLLEQADIPCQVVSDPAQRMLPPIAIEIRIQVPESDLPRARAVIAEHRRRGLQVLRGGRSGEPSERSDGEQDGEREREREQGP